MGLDLSLNCTGISIYDDVTNKIIFYNTIEPSKMLLEEDKLIYIQDYMINLLQTYSVTYAVLEDTFFSKNPKVLKTLMRVHGIIIGELNRKCVKYTYYTPCAIKKYMLGTIPKGTKTKALVALEVFKRFPYIALNSKDDITDSISIICKHLNI